MAGNRRGLRSGSTPDACAAHPSIIQPPMVFDLTSPPDPSIRVVRGGSQLPGLSSEELKLLREKQARLKSTEHVTVNSLPAGNHIHSALESTLIFAQYEAGTAVCIDAGGWFLTCAHCFGDDEEEYKGADKRKWLLFYDGSAIQVECRAWDPKRDLALLKVVTIESDKPNTMGRPVFQSMSLSSNKVSYKMLIFCIGQPGRDDLESTSERRTQYNLFEVSQGAFRGMVRGADPQDNSEIGTLMHDAWTYWGHSGAPLIREADGTLIGLHSSWNDQTTMRHGIPALAIREFLRSNLPVVLG